jgi:hypothetical protein
MSNGTNSVRFIKGKPAWNRKNLPIEDIVRLYESGISENKIAKMFESSRNIIRTRLLECGTKIRNSSEAEKLKWSQMTVEQRANQVRKAHDSVRGKILPIEQIRNIAIRRCKSLGKVGKGEEIFAKIFTENGIPFVWQKNWNVYNFDFFVFDSIAVELMVKSCCPLARKTDRKKIEDCVAANLRIVYFCVRDICHIRPEAIQEFIRRINILRADPSPQGQYWMIRSYRNTYTGFSCDFHDRSSIESLKSPFYAANE